MDRQAKCEYLKKIGFTYNPKSGIVTSDKGNPIKSKSATGFSLIPFVINNQNLFIGTHYFAFYWVYNTIPERIEHINGINNDNKIDNLKESTHQKMLAKQDANGYVKCKKTGKYLAVITKDRKPIYLGSFGTADEAHKAYLHAKENPDSAKPKRVIDFSDVTCRKCTGCKKVKPLDEFNKHKNYKFGVYQKCKKCLSELRKKYYPRYKAKIIANNKAWRAKNKNK